MTCSACRNRLSEWIDGRLAGEAARAVRQHLASCHACRQEEKALRATAALVAALPRSKAPDRLLASVLGRLPRTEPAARARALPWLRLLGAAAAVVLLASLAHRAALFSNPRPAAAPRARAPLADAAREKSGHAGPGGDKLSESPPGHGRIAEDMALLDKRLAEPDALERKEAPGRARRAGKDGKPAPAGPVRAQDAGCGPAPERAEAAKRAAPRRTYAGDGARRADHVVELATSSVAADANAVHELLERAVNPHTERPSHARAAEDEEASGAGPSRAVIEVTLSREEYRRFLAAFRASPLRRRRMRQQKTERLGRVLAGEAVPPPAPPADEPAGGPAEDSPARPDAGPGAPPSPPLPAPRPGGFRNGPEGAPAPRPSGWDADPRGVTLRVVLERR